MTARVGSGSTHTRAGCCMGGAEEEIWTLPWRPPPPSPQLGHDRKLNEIAGPGYPCNTSLIHCTLERAGSELDSPVHYCVIASNNNRSRSAALFFTLVCTMRESLWPRLTALQSYQTGELY